MKNNKIKLFIIIIFAFTIVGLVSIVMVINNAKISKLLSVASTKGVLLSSKEMNKEFSPNSKNMIKVNNELNSAWKLFQYPSTKESVQLPRQGLNLKFLDEKIKEKTQIESIKNFINKNNIFINKISKIKDLETARLVSNIIKPDYRNIDFSCRQVINVSFLFYVVLEDEIIKNNPSKAIEALAEISRQGTVLLHIPFSISNTAFITNTAFLLDGINRAINRLDLSDLDLQFLLVLLRKREKILKQNFQVLLKGVTFNFCQLVDERNHIRVGSMSFWHKIELNKEIPSNTLPFQIWPLFNKSIEKANMLEDVMEVKNTLINYFNFQLVKNKWSKFKRKRANRPSPSFASEYISFSKIFYENLTYIAYTRTQEALLASILYKRKNGKYPKNVAELSPEYLLKKDLVDPYSGNELRITLGTFNALSSASFDKKSNIVKKYKKSFGLRIYSVGSNGIDQGGRCGNGLILQGDNENDDITSILIIK